jgi:F-type H+-transporting ATPase subunit b
MHIDWYTLALQTVNFAVLVWLLQHFLYRPILRSVDARRAQIEQQLRAAQRTQAEATEHLAAIDCERAAIAAERAKALAAAAAEADDVGAARRAKAEREAAALLEDTRKTLAAERKEALEATERSALDLAAAFARRLLSDMPEPLRTEAWLDRIERHLAALPDRERATLTRQLSPAAPVTVVTANALAPAVETLWRGSLSRALGGGPVAFGVDPALGAGAELHFPNALLTFSLRGEVATLRSELERDATSRSAQA